MQASAIHPTMRGHDAGNKGCGASLLGVSSKPRWKSHASMYLCILLDKVPHRWVRSCIAREDGLPTSSLTDYQMPSLTAIPMGIG